MNKQIISTLEMLRPSDDENDFYSFAGKHNWQYSSGVTRGCFIIPNESHVVKFDINGYSACETEAQNYIKACDFRVEKVLLKTEYLFTNQYGIEFYIQPKISESVANGNFFYSKTFKRIIKTVSPTVCMKANDSMYSGGCSNNWMRLVISLYGKNFAKSLEKWTRECQVNDLHNGNIGVMKNKPYIFDYAGF